MLLREDSPLITTVRPQERLNLGHAAHLVRNTILGDATIEPYDSWYDPYADPNKKRFNKVSILCSRVETNCMWIQTLLIWSLIFLSYVEPPHWCRSIKVSEDTTNASMHEFGSCRILLSAKNEEYSYYPNFGWMFLTMDQSNFIQKIIVAILGFFLLLRFGRYGCELKRLFFPGAIRIINFSRCFLLMILLSNYAPVYEPFFRFLLFGSYLKKSQKEIIAITKMVRIPIAQIIDSADNTHAHMRISYISFQKYFIFWQCSVSPWHFIHLQELSSSIKLRKGNGTSPIGWRARGPCG
jgi:hypothetical protein